MSAIDQKYEQLGGLDGFLGAPTTPEVTPDGVGRFRHYAGGSIYWSPNTGAFELHGAIRDKWATFLWERGFLGYPVSDETVTPDGRGRYNHFQGGSIYWSPETGAFEVHGAIREKWAESGWEQGFLGYPVTDETVTPDGRGRYNHFQGGSIYWTPETGAHEVHGSIRDKWAELGWERSTLGYPTSDEQDGLYKGRISYFEGGSIYWRYHQVALTFVVQNMALLPPPASYKGTERGKAVAALIERLRQEQPDVVGLCEVFVDGERGKIKGDLQALYPYSLEGPDENDAESDGGLLLLSKYPIVIKHQTIYRSCKGEDCLANKGALHARIAAPSHPTPYDVFLTHLQSSEPSSPTPAFGVGSSGLDKVKAQLSHLGSFIRACQNPLYPALLMGDFNTNAFETDLYNDLRARLNYPADLWVISGNGGQGITLDASRSFSPNEPARSVDDSARFQRGKRIDYFFSWPGSRYWPVYQQTKVLVWQSSLGRDISDHYGLYTQQVGLQELRVNSNRPINRVTVSLNRFHCLEESDEVGSDEVYFRLYCQGANGANGNKKTKVENNVDKSEIHTFNPATTLSLGDPGAWLDIRVQGQEEDDWPNPDDNLGTAQLRLTRAELLELFGRSMERVFPLLTGDGSEYAVMVTIAVG
jgi:endonuclease/exonuclease/phosphatase family metal-dependent hydrolase